MELVDISLANFSQVKDLNHEFYLILPIMYKLRSKTYNKILYETLVEYYISHVLFILLLQNLWF